MNKLIQGLTFLTLTMLSIGVSALPISGSIQYAGTWDAVYDSGDPSDLIGVDFTSAGVVFSATEALSAAGPLLTLGDFNFDPVLSPSPVVLWTDGEYSFTLTNVRQEDITDPDNPVTLDLRGGGILSCLTCGLTSTNARWSFSANPGDANSFGFSASTVPEPATVALLGLSLVGAGFVRRRNKKA